MSAEKEINPYFYISSEKVVSKILYDLQLDFKMFVSKDKKDSYF